MDDDIIGHTFTKSVLVRANIMVGMGRPFSSSG